MRIQKPNKPLKNDSTSLNKKNKISLKLKLAEKSWLFSIIASFIGLLSLLTPILSISLNYYGIPGVVYYIQEWIFGYYNVYTNIYYSSPGSGSWYFREGFNPLPIHIVATILIVISHFAIFVMAAIKLKKKEHFVSPSLIYFSIVAMLIVIGYVAYFDFYFVQPCFGTDCRWELYITPGFAVYGQFISGFFVLINGCLGKTKR